MAQLSQMAATRDKSAVNAQLEHLQMKYVGTGHPDTSRYEWLVNHHRDSYASYVGHPSLLCYFAIGEGQAVGRTRFELLQKMVAPCGPPPPKEKKTL